MSNEARLAAALAAMLEGEKDERQADLSAGEISELTGLLRLATRLGDVSQVQPHVPFLRSAKSRLVRRIDLNALSHSLTQRSRTALGRPLAAFGALLMLVVLTLGLTASVALAASESLPGDPLYGMKVAAESVEVALAPDEAARARVDLRQADRRLEEADRLIERGRWDNVGEALAGAAAKLDHLVASLDILPEAYADDALADQLAGTLAKVASTLDLIESSSRPQVGQGIGKLRAAGAQASIAGMRLAPGRNFHFPHGEKGKAPQTAPGREQPKQEEERNSHTPGQLPGAKPTHIPGDNGKKGSQ